MSTLRRLAALTAVAVAGALSPGAARAIATDHLFVVTSDGNAGNCAAVDLGPPWSVAANLEPVGAHPVARHFLGLHWVVNGSPDDDVQVIDPATFDTVLQFSAGAGTDPRDIAVVDAGRAYVSRYDSPWVLLVDPFTGAALDSVDLGGFADADGLPECAWMELDGSHLLVQVQRVDRLVTMTTVPPAMLAVIDVDTNALIDTDPGTPGVQAIELVGSVPAYKMQRDAVARRLTVSDPGVRLDGAGGIEAVDLDALASLGLVLSEAAFSMDLGPHAIVSPTRGYVVGHTDFALSSHLVSFTIPGGQFLEEDHLSFSWVESLGYDGSAGVVYFPDPTAGVFAFDALTGDALAGPLATGLPPVDVVVVRDGPAVATPATGEPTTVRLVVAPNPSAGPASLLFRAPRAGPLRADLVDVTGRLVRRLETRPAAAGPARLTWDGRDDAGRPVARGVYMLRLEGNGFRAAAKVHRER
jgi:hypothetical protein